MTGLRSSRARSAGPDERYRITQLSQGAIGVDGVGSCSGAEAIPEATRAQNRERRLTGNGEEILVPGHENVCPTSDGRSENPSIVGVPHRDV